MTQNNHTPLTQLLKDCAQGFYQQMYFFGKDVTHPQGNQLQAYGFHRSPSKGLKGTSSYTHDDGERVVELYGACAGYYSPDANVVFIRNRCRFYHWISEHRLIAGMWDRNDSERLHPQELFEHLTPFLEWWVSYEQWIESRFGIKYRERCYEEWRKVNAQAAWLRPHLARQWVEEFIAHKAAHARPKNFLAGETKTYKGRAS